MPQACSWHQERLAGLYHMQGVGGEGMGRATAELGNCYQLVHLYSSSGKAEGAKLLKAGKSFGEEFF